MFQVDSELDKISYFKSKHVAGYQSLRKSDYFWLSKVCDSAVTQKGAAIKAKKFSEFTATASDTGKTNARIAKSIVLMPSRRSQAQEMDVQRRMEALLRVYCCQNPIRPCVLAKLPAAPWKGFA